MGVPQECPSSTCAHFSLFDTPALEFLLLPGSIPAGFDFFGRQGSESSSPTDEVVGGANAPQLDPPPQLIIDLTNALLEDFHEKHATRPFGVNPHLGGALRHFAGTGRENVRVPPSLHPIIVQTIWMGHCTPLLDLVS